MPITREEYENFDLDATNSKKILELLNTNKKLAYYGVEISEMLKIPSGSVRKCGMALYEKGVIDRKRIGLRVYYAFKKSSLTTEDTK